MYEKLQKREVGKALQRQARNKVIIVYKHFDTDISKRRVLGKGKDTRGDVETKVTYVWGRGRCF